jgi:membrane protease YdiL (CAAX protease family)
VKKLIPQTLLLFVIGLLVFVNYLLPLASSLVTINYDYRVFQYISVILSYLCITVWVWVESKNLEEFHLDRLALGTLIIFGLIRGTLGIPGEIYFKIIIWILNLLLLWAFIRNYRNIPRIKPRWILISLVSCLLVIPLAYIIHSLKITIYPNFMTLSRGFLWNAVRNTLFDLSFGAPLEEITMRGLLWGQLRRWGWTDKRIFWIQGILFWLLHFWQLLSNPLAFITIIPIMTLIFSLLVFYSKRVFPSIIFHTACNALITLFVQLYIK